MSIVFFTITSTSDKPFQSFISISLTCTDYEKKNHTIIYFPYVSVWILQLCRMSLFPPTAVSDYELFFIVFSKVQPSRVAQVERVFLGQSPPPCSNKLVPVPAPKIVDCLEQAWLIVL